MEGGEIQRIRDEEHLNILSIFNFVFAGLCLLGTVAFIPHLVFMQTETFEEMFDRQWEKVEERAERQGEQFPDVFTRETLEFLRDGLRIFVVGVMVLLAIAGGLCVLSGLGLRAHRRRGLSTVVAALQCLALPLGTVLGVITLVVMSRPSVVLLYRETEDPEYGPGDKGRP